MGRLPQVPSLSAAFLLRRAGGLVVVMALIALIVFVVVRVVPGDPAAVMLGSSATPQAIAERAPLTGLLTARSAGITVAIGMPVCVLSAVRRGRPSDHVATSRAMLFASLPSFWVGLTLIEYVAMRHAWFPVAARGRTTRGRRLKPG